MPTVQTYALFYTPTEPDGAFVRVDARTFTRASDATYAATRANVGNRTGRTITAQGDGVATR